MNYAHTSTVRPYQGTHADRRQVFFRRIDSSFLLPVWSRCLIKMLPVLHGRNGWQEDEATERGKQARGDGGGSGALSGQCTEGEGSILDEFTQVTGFHRKHAIRVLNQEASKLGAVAGGLRRGRIYDQAVQQALIVVWEAADRICAKRLKQIIPVLVGSMERYGHLTLDPEVRERLLKMSAATIDRLLKAIREVSNTGRRKSTIRRSCATASPYAPFLTGTIRLRASLKWIL
jgi:hypothetical protein